ncbi:Hypothetical_protein [Hexamita inflata]|uniref:Hypothetical_protein n=1 Tax=Hexamita inflata TaxID=28002 RepID=A0AA86TI44_9EUKA|nr:Hypothetical protein HINF_LOCUS5551 [Hexamita inflata]
MNLTLCTIYHNSKQICAFCPANASFNKFQLKNKQLILQQQFFFANNDNTTISNLKSYQYQHSILYLSDQHDLVSAFGLRGEVYNIILSNVTDFCVAFNSLFIVKSNFLYQVNNTNIGLNISNEQIFGTNNSLVVCQFDNNNICDFYNNGFQLLQSVRINGTLIKQFHSVLVFKTKSKVVYLDLDSRSFLKYRIEIQHQYFNNAVQTLNGQFVEKMNIQDQYIQKQHIKLRFVSNLHNIWMATISVYIYITAVK